MKKQICLMLIPILFLSGCASILSKSMYPVTINSHPDGATILIKDENGTQMYKGRTPTTITLRSGEGYFHGKSYTVEFSKIGYENQTATIQKELDGWYVGNILFGGLIGILIVDPLTGAMWKLPSDITITLAEQIAIKDGEQVFQVVSIDQLSPELKEHLIPIN